MRGPWINAIREYYLQIEDYENEWFKVYNELSEEELKQKYIEIFGKIYSVDELKKIETHGMSWNEFREFVVYRWRPVVEETYNEETSGGVSLYLINDDLDVVEYCLVCDESGVIKKQFISIEFDNYNYGKDFDELEEIFIDLHSSWDFEGYECEED